jgi:hypothetical protein
VLSSLAPYIQCLTDSLLLLISVLDIFFTENDYAGTEGDGMPLPIMIKKNRLIANALVLSVTPMVIGSAPLIRGRTIPSDDDPNSPNRAGESL